MKTIWKFPLETKDRQRICIPSNYKFLCVQVQGETPCLWTLVDDKSHLLIVEIATRGTGYICEGPEEMQYIGTYQLAGGELVFHVFGEA